MSPRSNIDAIAARLHAGESAVAIAADLGVTERTIRNWLHRAGCRPRLAGHGIAAAARLDDAIWLRDQHLDQAHSASAIAHRLDVTTADVRPSTGPFRHRASARRDRD